jgi:exonuclease SbcD
LSFSEKDYVHRVVEVVFDGTGGVAIASFPVPKTAKLLSLPVGKAAPIAVVLQMIVDATFDADLPPEAHPFLEVRILDDGPDPTRRRRIEEALAGKAVRLASIKLEAPVRAEAGDSPAVATPVLADLNSLDPEEIALSAHRERYRTEADPSVIAALREILVNTPLP